MTVLLDTSVLLRIGSEETPVGEALKSSLISADQVLVTPIARAEIAIKLSIGKLRLPVAEHVFWGEMVDRLQASELPFDASHAGRLAQLPLHHRDPFDRMIAAQCLVEGIALATTDPIFRLYGVELLA